MDDIPIKILKSNQELDVLLRDNPWEAVIYFASSGEEDKARELKDELLRVEEASLRKAQEFLQGQTLTDGVLISRSDVDGRCIVGVGGSRYDVELAPELKSQSAELIPGREVWVVPGTFQIVKLRDTYVQGEAAPVTEVLDSKAADDETEKEDTPGKEKASVPKPKRLLLRVKSRQEEIVVEAVPALADLKPSVGDTVRVLPTLGIALDLLSRGRGDVLLSEIPNVEYQDIGGLDAKVQQIKEAIEDPYVHPKVFQRYALQRPRGILLYGPPGCGKTMIAKAIANSLSQQIERSLQEVRAALKLYLSITKGDTVDNADPLYRQWQGAVAKQSNGDVSSPMPRNEQEWQIELEHFLRSRGIVLSRAVDELQKIEIALEQGSKSYFVSIKGPELLSKWVGETESSIRSIFAMARDRATFYTPVVLFFDELESMFSRRGSGISSDVQKTIVPQLLAEIDGIEETRNVIVIGASNRFDLIDSAVLRPGRLDFKIEIPRPNDLKREAPRSILSKYLTPDVPFPPADLDISPEAQAALGKAAVESAALTDSLSAALDNLTRMARDLESAIFLTDLYKGAQSPARKLSLRATSGINPEAKGTALETWRKDDGIAWEVVQSGKASTQEKDPVVGEGTRGVSAWPIVAPDAPDVVWGVLVVGYLAPELSKDVRAHADALAPAIASTIQARCQVASQLIERVLDILYHEESRLIITEQIDRQRAMQQLHREPLTLEKQVRDIISGSMLESIVSRAKRSAVKEEIEKKAFGRIGVTWGDLYNAIRTECEEGKDQYIYELYGDDPYGRGQAYQDTERFHVDVKLPPPDVSLGPPSWLTRKPYVWRKPGSKHRLPVAEGEQ